MSEILILNNEGFFDLAQYVLLYEVQYSPQKLQENRLDGRHEIVIKTLCEQFVWSACLFEVSLNAQTLLSLLYREWLLC